MKNLLVIIFFLFSLNSFAQKDKPKNWEIYTDTENKFSISYPNSWTVRKTSIDEKAKVFIKSPKENESDNFIENLNLIISKLTVDKLDLLGIKKTSISTLQKNQKNFELLKETNLKSNNVDAFIIEYKATKTIDNKEVEIFMAQQIMFKENYLYILTYTASMESTLSTYLNALKILESFKIF